MKAHQTDFFATNESAVIAAKPGPKRKPTIEVPPGAVEARMDGHPVRCISVLPPWGWLMVHGYKPVENRTWLQTFMVGNVCLIHSSGIGASKPKLQAEYDAAQWMIEEHAMNIQMPKLADMDIGGIIGLAKCRFAGDAAAALAAGVASSNFFVGPYGYWWKEAMPLPFIPYAGKLGFFLPRLLPEQWRMIEERRQA